MYDYFKQNKSISAEMRPDNIDPITTASSSKKHEQPEKRFIWLILNLSKYLSL